ncbi:MAG: methyltransferase domain-containing protein [Chitinophagales bacterium]|nr:methyltransferase domain-containing protein [Chitinophagales bacterium]
MAKSRGYFTGLSNIIRFNWHLYLLGVGVVLLLLVPSLLFSIESPLREVLVSIALMGFMSIVLSVVTSWYIYDLSGLYEYRWMDVLPERHPKNIVNIHAGYDETSGLLSERFPSSKLTVLNIFDKEQHTEFSLRQAQAAIPQSISSITARSNQLPLGNNSIDCVCLLFAAHEIRNDKERIAFFHEINRILAEDGILVVMEHRRDFANFLVYNIGAFHFFSINTWLKTFKEASFQMVHHLPHTPFISVFILSKNGIAP